MKDIVIEESWINSILKLYRDGYYENPLVVKLKKVDFLVLWYLVKILDNETFRDFKQKRVSNALGIDKSDVSKSIKRLKKASIIIENKSDDNFGYKLGNLEEIIKPIE